MSYKKYTWVTGEVITAAKLNHIEDGIAAIGSVQYPIEAPLALDGSPVFKAPNNAVKAGDTGVMTKSDGSQYCCIVAGTSPFEAEGNQAFVTLRVDMDASTYAARIDSWIYSAKDEGFIIKQEDDPLG